MENQIKRIENYLEQAEFDLKVDKEHSDKIKIIYQEGIVRGLTIALDIMKSK